MVWFAPPWWAWPGVRCKARLRLFAPEMSRPAPLAEAIARVVGQVVAAVAAKKLAEAALQGAPARVVSRKSLRDRRLHAPSSHGDVT